MKTYLAIAYALSLAFSSNFCVAQSAKSKFDPAGTWRWDFDMNGETIKHVLKLEGDKDGKVTGTLSARDMKMAVKDGKVEDGKLTFSVVADLGQPITIRFDGKLDGDKLDGKVVAETGDGERDFPWTAKRNVEASDIVGTWKLKIETPDGQTLQPKMTITEKDGKLQGKYIADDGQTATMKELRLKNNDVLFQIELQYGGSDLQIEFKGRPYGNKLAGVLEYSVGGESGAIEYTGQRRLDD